MKKFPGNTEVVRVYMRLYSRMEKVKEGVRKLLGKAKAGAYEYTQKSKAFDKFPQLKDWLLSLLKTPEDKVRENTRLWTWVGGTTFTREELLRPRLDFSTTNRHANPPQTPCGTPALYRSVAPSSVLDTRGVGKAWM